MRGGVIRMKMKYLLASLLAVACTVVAFTYGTNCLILSRARRA